MGQAPATNEISLRTMPRNFPGRSGVKEDKVYLCSPETCAASALTGEITDPRDLEKRYGMSYPSFRLPDKQHINTDMLVPPEDGGEDVELIKGPNISTLPDFEPLPDELEIKVLLKVGDDVSTDEIMPAGQQVLPYRSNVPKMAEFVYWQVDDTYTERAEKEKEAGGHAIVGGHNYGQGSSREHAAIVPRYLGLRAVLAKSFARIHWQNLANFGILALEFANESDFDKIERDDVLKLSDLTRALQNGAGKLEVRNDSKAEAYEVTHRLSARQLDMVLAGGLIPVFRRHLSATRA
jgi:aconitate hydratase